MNNCPPPNKLFLLTKIFGVCLLALFVFYGCKKMDIDSPTTRSQEKIERFFKLPMNASQVLKRIIEDLREKDANAPFVDTSVRGLRFDTVNSPVLIVPRAGMQHGSDRLYLDTGHWKLPTNPAVINSPNSKITVEHDLLTGKITYKIEELK
jgi:hypothetical protein